MPSKNDPRKAIVILGGSKSHKDFFKDAKDLGYLTIVFDKNKNCFCAKKGDLFFDYSYEDWKKIINTLNTLKNIEIKGILTYISQKKALISTSKISKHFKTSRPSIQSIETIYNKKILYQLLSLNNIKTPKTFNIKETGKYYLDKSLKYPLIIKPKTSEGGNYMTKKVKSGQELRSLINKNTRLKHKNSFIFQEFISGEQYNVNGFVRKGKISVFPILKKFTHDDNYNFSHLGYTTLTKTDKNTTTQLAQELKNIFIKLIKVTRVNNYFFSADMIVSNGRFFVIDFGPLLDSKVDRLFKYEGINIYKLLINIVTNKRPNYKERVISKKILTL